MRGLTTDGALCPTLLTIPHHCSQYNPSNDQCQGTTSEVRPEWNTQVDQRLSTINRVLTGLSTAWLRENVNENMTYVVVGH